MYYKEVFHLRMKAKRADLGISQGDVSKDIGILQADISKYENGNLEPTLEKLGKIADYYQVSTDWLLGCQYNKEEGNVMQTIIKELLNEIHEVVSGSFEQGGTREDIEIMIHNLIEDEFDKIKEKYEIK